jgi:signal transduction histidine kinase
LQAVVVRFDSLLDRFNESLARERRFAALASHELRTPLTHARAEIEAISEGSDHRAGVERSIRAIDHLTELVDALLWFAKAQERLEPSHLDVVNLADLVRAELALMVPANAIDSQLPEEALVSGDERLLARVVANLLDNARKYGSGEPVNVALQRAGEHLELEVTNAGKIAVADTERLFEPFYRQPGSASLAPGFGLGLAFARAVARAHGGDLAFTPSQCGQTTFSLRLPLLAWSTNSDPSENGASDSGSVQLEMA